MSSSEEKSVKIRTPQLGVGHFLLWMGGTSIALAALNFAFPMVRVPAEHFTAESIRRFVGATAYGAAIASWLWILFRRWTGQQFELRHPGHYLIVIACAIAIVDLELSVIAEEAVQLELLSDYEADDLRMLFSYVIGCFLCIVFRNRVFDRAWRLGLALMATRCIVRLGISYAEVRYDFTGIPQSNTAMYFNRWLCVMSEGALIGISGIFATMLLVEFIRRKPQRDWIHLVGVVAALAICINASVGELRYGQLIPHLGLLLNTIQETLCL
jgi:hypothetical protein